MTQPPITVIGPTNSSRMDDFVRDYGNDPSVQLLAIDAKTDPMDLLPRIQGTCIRYPLYTHSTEVRQAFDLALTQTPGIHPLNRSRLLSSNIRSKLVQYVRFLQAGVPTVPSYLIHTLKDIETLVLQNRITFPFIFKSHFGSLGHGVYLIENLHDLPVSEEQFSEFIIQPFIENTCDYRIIVVGGKSIGGISRSRNPEADFRNNISQGGMAKDIHEEPFYEEMANLAVKATHAMQLDYAGVDVIISNGEMLCLEVNSNPGWKGFTPATGISVPKALIEHIRHKESSHRAWTSASTRLLQQKERGFC